MRRTCVPRLVSLIVLGLLALSTSSALSGHGSAHNSLQSLFAAWRPSLGHCHDVEVNFYGEALCPFCVQFLNLTVGPMLAAGIQPKFNYYAWGNAHVNATTGQVVCQHGELECKLNTLLNCAMHGRDTAAWFPFVHCVEVVARDPEARDVPRLAAKCAAEAKLPLRAVLDCYEGPQGRELSQKAREATDALDPPHTYVPWVTVNGVPIFGALDSLPTIVCAAEGRSGSASLPDACFVDPQPDDGDSASRIVGRCSRGGRPAR